MPQMNHTIHLLLPLAEPVSEKMRRLIEVHAKEYPTGDWSPFLDLPYDQEAAQLKQNWLPEMFLHRAPSSLPAAGLFFGLYQPEVGRGRKRETVADFYVAGTRQFDLDSEGDWAVQPAYFPRGRYANSQILADIYRRAYGTPNGLGNQAEQYLCLGYVAFLIPVLLAGITNKWIVKGEGEIGIAAGWDSGEPLYLGMFTKQGFRVRDPQEAIAGIQKRTEEFERQFQERFGKQSDS
jgi:hypothetical protein